MALTSFLLESGFCKSQIDASVFIFNHDGITCYFMVYVDDIVLTGNNSPFIAKFVEMLATRLSVKDLGHLNRFLDVEIIPTKYGIFLNCR